MIQQINRDFMLHLDLYIKDCSAEFYFNDIPVRLMGEGENFHSMNAHHLLLDGTNQMEVVINPGPTPSTVRELDEQQNTDGLKNKPSVCIRLMSYPVGAFAGDTKNGRILMQLNWEYDAEQHKDIRFPYSVSDTRDLGPMLGPWIWQQCQPIDLLTDMAAIEKTAELIYNAFVSGDAQTVVRYCDPSLKDIGKALPAYGEQEFRSDMLTDISSNRLLASKAEPFNKDSTDFRLCANGRMVQLINSDWSHTIRSPEDDEGERYELPAFLGKIQNQWYVVL
ncbi:hypothetical protein [Aestuariibacter salexigens]|uniref:hypothetical protein n=1 Tax=Aestuariibacter salexigens TaxID=226010 RepID=UPI0004065C60|nr:hypothetical protein [Aestuariibacter salexigens]